MFVVMPFLKHYFPILCALLCILVFVPASSVANSNSKDTIQEIRLWHAPEKTRLVIDLSEPAAYKVFSLKNPDRLVIDLKDTKRPKKSKIPSNFGKLIRGLRTANREKTDLRIVIDLRHPLKMEHFALKPQEPYGHRVVVDLFVPENLIPEEDPVIAILQKRMFEQKLKELQKDRQDEKADSKKPQLIAQRDVIVAIDAGHGGEDPGALGQAKTLEKDIVLSISKRLQRELNSQPGITGLLTRKGDYFVPLADRVSISHQKYKADFFVSIHADAAQRRSARGASVYILGSGGVNRTLSLYLQEQEKLGNALGSSQKDLSSLNKVLADLSLDGSMQHSELAAETVLDELGKISKMHSKKVKRNNFQVLRNPYMPAMLVETGFISNRQDERLLKTKRHQERLAQAIAQGIVRYFKKQPPPSTYFSSLRNNPIITHVVKRGEYLSGIAKKYQTTTKQIIRSNNLKSDKIRIGQKLLIPQGLD